MIEVTVTIVRSLNVTAEIKGVIGLTFSGIRDNVIDGNSITLLDTVIP
jgi:hypothetical protein